MDAAARDSAQAWRRLRGAWQACVVMCVRCEPLRRMGIRYEPWPTARPAKPPSRLPRPGAWRAATRARWRGAQDKPLRRRDFEWRCERMTAWNPGPARAAAEGARRWNPNPENLPPLEKPHPTPTRRCMPMAGTSARRPGVLDMARSDATQAAPSCRHRGPMDTHRATLPTPRRGARGDLGPMCPTTGICDDGRRVDPQLRARLG